MLKNRFSRFLTSIIVFALIFAALYIIDTFYLEQLFPNAKKMPVDVLWRIPLYTFEFCLISQFLSDIMNVDKILNNGFVTFIKRVIFFAAALIAMLMAAFEIQMLGLFSTNYVEELEWFEATFCAVGVYAPAFVLLAHIVSYIRNFGEQKKVLIPFYFVFAYGASLLLAIPTAMFIPAPYWIDILLALIVICIFLCFKTGTWPFEEYDGSGALASALRLGDADIADHKLDVCRDCIHFRSYYDENGFFKAYCARSGHEVSDYEPACFDYREKRR